jgi:chromosome partitioning protein
MLTINALVASNSVILPMEAHYESYEALSHILDVIARIKANYNPDLTVEGILITKYQSRTRLCREVSKFTEQNFGDKVHIFPETIPLSITAAELSSLGESIFEHAPQSEVAAAYKNLAEEVMSNA